MLMASRRYSEKIVQLLLITFEYIDIIRVYKYYNDTKDEKIVVQQQNNQINILDSGFNQIKYIELNPI